MLESSEQHFDDIYSEEDTTSRKPLGIINPLLPPKPLGQRLLQPKFLTPLGATPLINFEVSDFLIQEIPDYSLGEYSLRQEPFLGESSLSLLESDGTVFASNTGFSSSNNNVIQPFRENFTETPLQRQVDSRLPTDKETKTTLSRQTNSDSPKVVGETQTSVFRQVESDSPKVVGETQTSVFRQVESDSPKVVGETQTSVSRQTDSDSPKVVGETQTSISRQISSDLPEVVGETQTSVFRQVESDSPEVVGETQTSVFRQVESDSPKVVGETQTSVSRQISSDLPEVVGETQTSVSRQIDSDSPKVVGETQTFLPLQVDSRLPTDKETKTTLSRQISPDSPEVVGETQTSVSRQVESRLPTEGISELLTSEAVTSPTSEKDYYAVKTSPTNTTNPISIKPVEIDSGVTVAQLFSKSQQIPVLPISLKNLIQSKPLGQSTYLGQASAEEQHTSSLPREIPLTRLSQKASQIIQKQPNQSIGSSPDINQKTLTKSLGVTHTNLQKSQVTSLPQSSQMSSSQDSTNQIFRDDDMPTTWSSIADLLGENTATDHQSTVIPSNLDQGNTVTSKPTTIQRQKDETTGDIVFTPEGFIRANSLVNNSQSRTLTNNKSKASIIQAKKISHTITTETKTPIQKVEAVESEPVTISAIKPQEEADNYSLELLAQEIYRQVIYRLKIDKERQGRNYSGRLPW